LINRNIKWHHQKQNELSGVYSLQEVKTENYYFQKKVMYIDMKFAEDITEHQYLKSKSY
jgi:hypothetical protein